MEDFQREKVKKNVNDRIGRKRGRIKQNEKQNIIRKFV